ncbi:4-hydroxyphenylacetate 3-hydroxylase family protein [Streptomyces albipurpureus]|uniref:4-hydroxyphenylacetate 3-hydroxylase family protein n=1 Tax=Streptomyces albipurpureus TaxID=2897419 RepID=A0ABT0UQ93_9ACTN|nr:4-hydroxyphenylacetate 3-hydroxylase family protein [Streptomyces sp. CWNU-1]MCM2390629.1 4-hydroxyphenylacetate 3-hydroxylase family protein [Streptomyces sp. CWNU-1]
MTDTLLDAQSYLESLRDGRTVYIDGEKVKDVTEHPAFRNSARSVARLYDALHDPELRDVLTYEDDQGIRTHRFFAPSRTPDELLRARDAIAAWSRLSYGFMGRTPDYKAAFMASLSSSPDLYAPYADNARSWYRRYASQALFLNHVLVNPPVDRSRPVHEVGDVYVHVVRDNDRGIVVSGAKMLATGSALTHATFVAQNSAVSLEAGKAEDFALAFIAPMDTPGCVLLSRTSYEARAASPFDHPLSSRFDENDAVLVFKEALIPWENVLIYRDVEKANSFFPRSGFVNRSHLQAGTRFAVKLDLMAGLLARAVTSNGTGGFRGVQAALGEVITLRNTAWALTTVMAMDPVEGPGGTVMPNIEHAGALRMFTSQAWERVRELFETHLGGAPLVVPSSHRDLAHPELRPLIDQFYRGSDSSAESRIKLFKLVWDAIGSEFGGRHGLYERVYSGNADQVRIDALNAARRGGLADRLDALVGQCLGDYDLDGWTRGPWTRS